MNWKLPVTDTYFRPILDQNAGGFEIDHLDFALKYVKKFRCAVDGGAHVGIWSMHMAKYFTEVMAFEPALDTFECLVENTKSVYPRVVAVHAALGASTGKCQLASDLTRPGNTGSRMVANYGISTPMVSLDAYVFLTLDFIK